MLNLHDVEAIGYVCMFLLFAGFGVYCYLRRTKEEE